jgi:hypothetical protein
MHEGKSPFTITQDVLNEVEFKKNATMFTNVSTNRTTNKATIQTTPEKLMRKYSLPLLLLALCAGCAHHRPTSMHSVALAPNESQIEELSEASPAATSLGAVVPQFSRGAPPVLISQRPAYSMQQALFNVQRLSQQPIVAMTQYRNWYFYATDVARDPNTQAIQDLRGGYAVQKGGYLAWKW